MEIKRLDSKPMVIKGKKKLKVHVHYKRQERKSHALKSTCNTNVKMPPNVHVKSASGYIYKKVNRNKSYSDNSNSGYTAKTKDINLKNTKSMEISNTIQPEYRIKKHRGTFKIPTHTILNSTYKELEGGEELKDSITILDTLSHPIKKFSKTAYEKGANHFHKSAIKKKLNRKQENSHRNEKEEIKENNNLHKGSTFNEIVSKEIVKSNITRWKKLKIKKKWNAKTPMFQKYVHKKQNGIKNKAIKKALKKASKKPVQFTKQYLLKYLIGTFGGMFLFVVLTALPVVTTIAIIYNSPFAIFMPAIEEGDTILTVLSQYESEFQSNVNQEIERLNNCDTAEIIYENFEGDSATINNYYDVIAVYMVKHGVGDTATIVNDISKANLKKVFDAMNSYSISYDTKSIELEEGEEKQTSQKVKIVQVKKKSYLDMVKEWKLSKEEIEILEEIMQPENLAMLGNINGDIVDTSIPPDFENLVDGEIGSEAVKIALSKIGTKYSQEKRDQDGYYDCSSFMYYTYKALGIDISHGGQYTAAEEARGLHSKGYTVSYSQMKAGDLIFYSFKPNGRFLNINHVGMYCANGKIVDASFSQQKVVYRSVYAKENIVLIGRPSMLIKNK